jgi:hypothetical protein
MYATDLSNSKKGFEVICYRIGTNTYVMLSYQYVTSTGTGTGNCLIHHCFIRGTGTGISLKRGFQAKSFFFYSVFGTACGFLAMKIIIDPASATKPGATKPGRKATEPGK